MDQETSYKFFNTRISGTPEQFAAFMIDWCRQAYRIYGIVPRITLRPDGSVAMVEGIQATQALLNTHTFNDAFEILNGKPPDAFELEPGYRYIHRAKGSDPGDHRRASKYHIPDKDFTTSLCGQVQAGEGGFEIVFNLTALGQSMICGHCYLKGQQG